MREENVVQRHTVIVILVVGLSGVSGAATAAKAQAVDPAFERDIIRLMDTTGAPRLGEQIAAIISTQMFQNLRQARPDIPPRALDIADEVVRTTFARMFSPEGGALERLVSVYARHFTHDDIRALIAFHETPVGRKVVSVMPQVTQESAQIGQEWAATVVPELQAEIRRRLAAEGLIK
jgi:hypothetical protein